MDAPPSPAKEATIARYRPFIQQTLNRALMALLYAHTFTTAFMAFAQNGGILTEQYMFVLQVPA